MDLQAFWLTNTCRLLYDMKQYSGDKVFAFDSSPIPILAFSFCVPFSSVFFCFLFLPCYFLFLLSYFVFHHCHFLFILYYFRFLLFLSFPVLIFLSVMQDFLYFY